VYRVNSKLGDIIGCEWDGGVRILFVGRCDRCNNIGKVDVGGDSMDGVSSGAM
jgi:hypothetical protein